MLITRRNLNQNRKYFNPMVSGPGTVGSNKEKRGRKSRWTVPITSVVDPDPHGSGTFAWIRIRNYCSGYGCSKT